jgi:hypothetical protein
VKAKITGVLAVMMCALTVFVSVKDGGSVEFYWRPLLAIWYAVTLLSFFRKSPRVLATIKTGWWMQLGVPLALFGISVVLVSVYEPYPIH